MHCLALLLFPFFAGGGISATANADAVQFWGAKASVSLGTPIDQLKRGEFLWMANAVPLGPVLMVVSITEQKGYVYRNGVLIGATTVSTGRPGHQTPTGVFTVLQKQKEHHSTIYDGAPMPYMERLTWGGVALHAGGLSGYPESHGCVHLPTEFARELFAISPTGMTVVIANEATAPTWVSHPGYLAPVTAVGGRPVDNTRLADDFVMRWQPELSPSGPVSIVLSHASHIVVVYRNGIEIGQARLSVSGNGPFGNHVLVLMHSPSNEADPFVPDSTKYRWSRIAVPGHAGEAGEPANSTTVARIKLPMNFVRQLDAILQPGATLFVTDAEITPQSTGGAAMRIVDTDPPDGNES